MRETGMRSEHYSLAALSDGESMNNSHKRMLSGVAGVLLLVTMYFVGRETAVYVSGRGVQTRPDARAEQSVPSGQGIRTEQNEQEGQNASEEQDVQSARFCVVIDAGHGGMDPGKIGINDASEKEINLKIALKLKTYLEFNDIKVVMTRETDSGLYDADASNKKVQDMKRRLALIEETAPALVVSIHQNSYPEEYVHGAQVFYYSDSREGKRLAEKIQTQFLYKLDGENTRQVKANNSYYLLKKTSVPIVIAECGFLSNRKEAEKLCDEVYQDRAAWAVCMGILQYLNES